MAQAEQKLVDADAEKLRLEVEREKADVQVRAAELERVREEEGRVMESTVRRVHVTHPMRVVENTNLRHTRHKPMGLGCREKMRKGQGWLFNPGSQ